MKFISLFGKKPQHRQFNYTPRFYDAREEERLKREVRIRAEIEAERRAHQLENDEEIDTTVEETVQYTSRIAGSFRSARRNTARSNDPSASLLRFGIIIFLVLLAIAYLQYGNYAAYGVFLLVPFYLFLRFRGVKKNT